MNSAILAWFWDVQYRIESRFRRMASAYSERHHPMKAEDWEWMMGYVFSAFLAGVAIGFILWGLT